MAKQTNNSKKNTKKPDTKKAATKKSGTKKPTIKKEEFTMEIRSKSAELFKSDNRMEALKRFLVLKPETAAWLLWRMSVAKHVADYAEEIADEEQWQKAISRAHDMKGKCLQKLGLPEDDVSFEEIIAFRNELRYQYQQNYSDFMNLEADGAFKALKDKAGVVEACTVYDHCILKLHGEQEELQRLLFLLGSERENFQFGGLRDLDFKKDEASYLKPYIREIHDLFLQLSAGKRKAAEGNKPMAGLADKLQDKGVTLPKEAKTVNKPAAEEIDKSNVSESVEQVAEALVSEEPVDAGEVEAADVASTFKKLTAHEVLANRELFAALVGGNKNVLVDLANMGYDLNEVLKQEPMINVLLVTAKAFEE